MVSLLGKKWNFLVVPRVMLRSLGFNSIRSDTAHVARQRIAIIHNVGNIVKVGDESVESGGVSTITLCAEKRAVCNRGANRAQTLGR